MQPIVHVAVVIIILSAIKCLTSKEEQKADGKDIYSVLLAPAQNFKILAKSWRVCAQLELPALPV